MLRTCLLMRFQLLKNEGYAVYRFVVEYVCHGSRSCRSNELRHVKIKACAIVSNRCMGCFSHSSSNTPFPANDAKIRLPRQPHQFNLTPVGQKLETTTYIPGTMFVFFVEDSMLAMLL